MSSKFVYVTFIKASPQKVWDALTGPEFQKQYWLGYHWESAWKEGAPWKMVRPDGTVTDSGEIIESNPPKRLVMKWRNEFRPELAAEGHARCTYEIESGEGIVKLTVTHEIGVDNSKFIEAVSGGWPMILSNLKTLLETGRSMPEIGSFRKAS